MDEPGFEFISGELPEGLREAIQQLQQRLGGRQKVKPPTLKEMGEEHTRRTFTESVRTCIQKMAQEERLPVDDSWLMSMVVITFMQAMVSEHEVMQAWFNAMGYEQDRALLMPIIQKAHQIAHYLSYPPVITQERMVECGHNDEFDD